MQRPDPRSATNTNPSAEAGILARIALALTDWTERWVPDAFVFALLATLIVIVAGVALTPSRLPQVIDRKSTRLNSSHLGISYAVFCLKKKKTTNKHSYTKADKRT